jgi:hypothetical protein
VDSPDAIDGKELVERRMELRVDMRNRKFAPKSPPKMELLDRVSDGVRVGGWMLPLRISSARAWETAVRASPISRASLSGIRNDMRKKLDRSLETRMANVPSARRPYLVMCSRGITFSRFPRASSRRESPWSPTSSVSVRTSSWLLSNNTTSGNQRLLVNDVWEEGAKGLFLGGGGGGFDDEAAAVMTRIGCGSNTSMSSDEEAGPRLVDMLTGYSAVPFLTHARTPRRVPSLPRGRVGVWSSLPPPPRRVL